MPDGVYNIDSVHYMNSCSYSEHFIQPYMRCCAVLMDEMTENRISGIAVREEDLVELICDLVRIPSYPGVSCQESGVADYISAYFNRAGIESVTLPVIDGRRNVHACLRGSGAGRNLLFNGHLDTVPPYDMSNALAPVIKGRSIHGRGTTDMKGALACMMTAMRLLSEAAIPLRGDMVFSGVIDEELTSLGTRSLLKDGRASNADAAIVGEPMGFDIGIGHKGLQWFEFTIHGRAVHGGEQELGINAIRNASRLIERMEGTLVPEISARFHPVIGTSTLNYGYIRGGFQPSTVAGECRLQIDRRWIPGEKYEDIVREFQSVIDELAAEHADFSCDFEVMESSVMEEGILHEGFVTDSSHPLVTAAENAIYRYAGITPVKRPFKAWTDGGLLAAYGKIPTVILGPGALSCAHTDAECIDIDQALAFVRVYMSVIAEYCG